MKLKKKMAARACKTKQGAKWVKISSITATVNTIRGDVWNSMYM